MHWLIALVVMSLGLFSFAQPKSSKSPLPHFIEELKISCPGPTDPFKMRQELYTALMQTRAMWPPDVVDSDGNVLSGWISTPNIVGSGIWSSVIVHKKEVKVYLRDYREKDGKYIYYDARGPKELTEKQFKDLINYIQNYLSESTTFLYNNLKHLIPKDQKVDPNIQKSISVAPGISVTLDRVLSQPKIYGPESFVPDELYIGPISPWGMVYLGLYGDYNRRVFMHPEAMVYDCLQGKPLVLSHELVHAQPTLQWLPLSTYIEIEMLTELNSGLWEAHFWELLHPYLAVLNDLIWATFGYSYIEAGGTIDFRSSSAGLIWMNPDRVVKHQKIWEKIAPELRKWVTEDLMPQLYEDSLYAMAINMKYCWDSAFTAISFLSRFELAGMGGYEQTQHWLQERDQTLEEVWQTALIKTGDEVKTKEIEEFSKFFPGRSFCPQPFSFMLLQDPRIKALKRSIQEDYKQYGRTYIITKMMRGGYRFSLNLRR
jgi:hypothetical protein